MINTIKKDRVDAGEQLERRPERAVARAVGVASPEASKGACLREGITELLRGGTQPFVARPEFCPSDRCGGQQVNIDVSEPLAVELVRST